MRTLPVALLVSSCAFLGMSPLAGDGVTEVKQVHEPFEGEKHLGALRQLTF